MDKEKSHNEDGFNNLDNESSLFLFFILANLLDSFGYKHEIEKLKLEHAEMKGKLDIIEKIITQ